jgi:NADH:ubiquinone oxidoreductase subunit E
MAEIKELVGYLTEKYGKERENLIPVLRGVVQKHNFISDEAMVEVARKFDISAAEVYGTASFYAFLDTEQRGKHIIKVCKSITCDMKGKNKIIKALENELKIKVGETTQDKLFSLIETNCIGLCDKGPAMLINCNPFTELTPEKIHEIICDFRTREKKC